MCRVPSWGRDETSSQTQEQLTLAVASRLELHLPLFALLGSHRPFSPSHCAKVACRRIAQQHRNIGISSFLCKKRKFLGKHHGRAFFSHLFFFLKGERENELQAKKREEVTDEKNRA